LIYSRVQTTGGGWLAAVDNTKGLESPRAAAVRAEKTGERICQNPDRIVSKGTWGGLAEAEACYLRGAGGLRETATLAGFQQWLESTLKRLFPLIVQDWPRSRLSKSCLRICRGRKSSGF
jgi:hypothetical protein